VPDPTVIRSVSSRTVVPDETASLHRQLLREREARRLAEQLAGEGIDTVLREQRELMLLGRVAVASNEATSLGQAIEECLSLVARHAGWPVATMWIRDRDRHELYPSGRWFCEHPSRFDALVDAVSSRLTVPPGSLPGVVATSGAPQWLEGLRDKPNWLRGDRDGELGVATVLAVPVWAGPQVIGVVALFHEESIPRFHQLLELIEQVVTQLGVAVRRFEEPAVRASSLAGGIESEWVVTGVAGIGHNGGDTAQLAKLAHEIRTPLHGLIGSLELLADGGLDPECRALSEAALRSALDLHSRLEGWLHERGPGSFDQGTSIR